MRIRVVAVACSLAVVVLPGVLALLEQREQRARGAAWCVADGGTRPACEEGAALHHRVCARMTWGRAGPPAEPPAGARGDYVTCILGHPNRHARELRKRAERG